MLIRNASSSNITTGVCFYCEMMKISSPVQKMDFICVYDVYVSWRRESGLSPPVKYFTDRSKAVLLLWIIYVIYVLCFSCFHVFSLLPYGHLLGKG